MTHASLFSGIEGFGLAAQWMGWENVFHCEINEFGQLVIKHHHPNSILHENIKTTDFTIYRGKIDVLSGGFPCQPYSLAGQRKGKEDERHLWPEMLRAIREIKPRWVVGENVLGIVSWSGGMVFEEVQADLEAEGYEVQPYVLPAAGVGAPHQRYRVWFVAYSNSARLQKTRTEQKTTRDQQYGELGPLITDTSIHRWTRTRKRIAFKNRKPESRDERKLEGRFERLCTHRNVTDTDSIERRKGRLYQDRSKETERHPSTRDTRDTRDTWKNFPTQSPVCIGNDGFSTELLRQRIREDSMGYLSEKEIDTIVSKAFTAWRTESIKAAGNAIVPQVVYQIFKAIQEYDSLTPHRQG